MAKSEKSRSEAVATKPVAANFDALLERAGAKDRTNIMRHLEAAEAGEGHAKLWRRLAATLGALAPHGLQTVGQHAVQFFIADGKYRMQVFAIEDQRDGKVMVYLPDVMDEAIKKKVLSASSVPDEFNVVGQRGETLHIEALTASNTPDAPVHFKHMLGWNRKALRLTLPSSAAGAQVTAAEALFALAAKGWAAAK